MRVPRLFAALGAALLTLGLGILPTSAAAAGGATIVMELPIFLVGEPTPVTGTCPVGTASVLVSVSVGTTEVGSATTTPLADGSWKTDVTATSGSGNGVATAYCLKYGEPIATATLDVSVFGGLTIDDATLTVSPDYTVLGSTAKAAGRCPVGATDGILGAGNDNADEPFQLFDITVDPATGAYSAPLPIVLDPTAGSTPPVVGPASALVLCFGGDLPPVGPDAARAALRSALAHPADKAAVLDRLRASAPRDARSAKDIVFGMGMDEFDIVTAATITASPSVVALGSPVTVTASCPMPPSKYARIQVFDPEGVAVDAGGGVLDATGHVTFTSTYTAADGFAAGDLLTAQVRCTTDAGMNDVVTTAETTFALKAGASSGGGSGSGGGGLPMTGADPMPLTYLGAGLLLAGATLLLSTRALARARRRD